MAALDHALDHHAACVVHEAHAEAHTERVPGEARELDPQRGSGQRRGEEAQVVDAGLHTMRIDPARVEPATEVVRTGVPQPSSA